MRTPTNRSPPGCPHEAGPPCAEGSPAQPPEATQGRHPKWRRAAANPPSHPTTLRARPRRHPPHLPRPGADGHGVRHTGLGQLVAHEQRKGDAGAARPSHGLADGRCPHAAPAAAGRPLMRRGRAGAGPGRGHDGAAMRAPSRPAGCGLCVLLTSHKGGLSAG